MRDDRYGVEILGSGSAVPPGTLSNHDLEQMIDTSDEWIRQRTGVRIRHKCDPDKGEGTLSLSTEAMRRALENAKVDARELDLLIVASVTGEMSFPSTACRVTDALGAAPAGAFDVLAACSGFVYGLNLSESLIASGRYETIGIVGCDAMSTVMDYSNRKTCVLFGDAAGAVVVRKTDDRNRGCMYQAMNADGSGWHHLYCARDPRHAPEGADWNEVKLNYLQMNGPEVYKFAVQTFQKALKDALEACHLSVGDIKMLIAHQSNARIIESAKQKMGLPDEKVIINIDEYGNSSAGSVPLCFDQLWRAGRIGPGDIVVMVAFGAGMTWASSVWRL
ncbi:MAG: 3-oxoacyl-ACP synthase III family protein [Phycisphaerales bacterium]